jgi:hypothetical protein
MKSSRNNYKNRRQRGQCAMCTNPSPNSFRCPDCRVKYNAYTREMRFKKSIEREQRLEALELQLEKEVRELEKQVLGWHKQ